MSNPPTDSAAETPSGSAIAHGGRRHLAGRLGRLTLKELREIFRDRRTIITLVVMPVLIYPLLALVFQRFLVTSLSTGRQSQFFIAVETRVDQSKFWQQVQEGQEIFNRRAGQTSPPRPLEEGKSTKDRFVQNLIGANNDEPLPEPQWVYLPAADIRRSVTDGSINLGVIARQTSGVTSEAGLATPLNWELIYRPGSSVSEKALRFVESSLTALNDSQLDRQLRRLNVTAVVPAAFTRYETQETSVPFYSLAALIPLILVLTTVTGAVYPAIDLTAGERERGTLEMLIATPMPRLGLLLGKYVAVLAVALVTAVVNLAGMTITAKSTGLAAVLFPQENMSLLVILRVGLLLCLLAAFFSAVLLAITSYAHSFKEAQAYIIPLMLVCLVPGVVCLLPSLEFNGILAVTPLMNIVMLSRDVLEGDVAPELAAATIVSTIFYIVAALSLAARIFGTDAVLYGSPATWADIFRRPDQSQSAATPSAAMFALAVMFPTYFVLAGSLGQTGESVSLGERLVLVALATAFVFVAIPLAIATYHRTRPADGLAIRNAPALALAAALVLGLSLWPLAHETFLLNRWLGVTNFERGEFALAQALADELRRLSPALVVLCLGAVPGICEEFFFRGFLFGAVRRVATGRGTVVAVAVLFGLFHTVGGHIFAPERFLPSAFMGLALGWVRLRTGSVQPCMLLHAAHNSILLAMLYLPNSLVPTAAMPGRETHLPASWLLAAAIASAVGAAIVAHVSHARNSRSILADDTAL